MLMGIDFGTCFSTVSVMVGNTPNAYFMYDPNKTGIPTEFMYSAASGRELYGYECSSYEAAQNADQIIRYMKKQIRKSPAALGSTVTSGGKSYTLREILKKYLSYLITEAKREAEERQLVKNTEIERVTVAAPVGISAGQMTAFGYNDLLIETVSEVAGIPKSNVYVIEEPVAAALSYFNSNGMRGKSVEGDALIFDLGGGTLDVSVVRYDKLLERYEVVAKDGLLDLGGNNWDQVLAQLVIQESGFDGKFESKRDESDFNKKILKAKIELSTEEEAAVNFRSGVRRYGAFITRADFEAATKDLLDRAMELTKKTVSECGGISTVSRIVTVGGGSNMPAIRERLEMEFPSLKNGGICQYEPSLAIAKGAAIYSYLGESGVDDVAAHTYGFYTRRASDNQFLIHNLIFKGQRFGIGGVITERTEGTFTAIEDTQTALSFKVYESDGKMGTGEDARWMSFGENANLNGVKATVNIPDEYLGKATQYTVYVTFKLVSGKSFEIVITDSDGNYLASDKKQL